MRLSGKLTGFVVLLSAAVLMAALWLVLSWRPSSSSSAPGPIILIAIGGGLLCGLIFRVWVSRLTDAEVDRLGRHVEGMGQAGASPSTYRPLPWTQSLYEAINAAFSHLHRSVEKLEAKRRELEIQVRIAQSELQDGQAVLHAISDAVVVTDAFNELSLANPTAARILHFNPDDDESQPIDRFLSDPMLVKLIKDAREIGNIGNSRHVEHRMCQDGSPRVYDVALSCMANKQKEVSGVVTILRDITHEKEIAEMKSDFVSGVSHELRTPLSSIKAYIEMLVDG
ncbi:MAG: cell wall metabolism sensor histidine kinase WalK, partial [Phycisphaerae bacterium]|nr:cell wall metabolism sensor histidine kinase WalK [Phycisphaerae bacterium]